MVNIVAVLVVPWLEENDITHHLMSITVRTGRLLTSMVLIDIKLVVESGVGHMRVLCMAGATSREINIIRR